jgi:predicted RNA-binding protein with PUA-like domain
MPSYWIVKTEPSTYSYDDLHRDGKTVWDGVRNNLALKHIRSMAKGDEVLVYHSGADKALAGLAVVASDPYPDPKAKDEKLAVVDLRAVKPLPRCVTLAEIKADGGFKELALVRMPRLSVMPVPVGLWKRLVKMAGS